MKEFILITGASSGMGYEMAKLLAKQRFNLILVARRIEILETLRLELNEQYGVTICTMKTDLTNAQNAVQLYDDIRAKDLRVTVLINNAGFGDYGNFLDIPLNRQVDMINVNVTSLMVLCKLFLADMKEAGKGKVMNIASLLSYIPFPYYSVYSATKTFVLAFTETLAAEFEGTGIEIKALCPGPVATEFNTEEMLNTNAYKANKPIPAKTAAAAGVKHLFSGKGSKKIGLNTWFISNLPRITPDKIMMKIKKNLSSQQKSKFFVPTALVVLLIIATLITNTVYAQNRAQISWPEKYEPTKSRFYVHNEIEINASPEKVWNIIIDAAKWESFYKGAKNISLVDSSEKVLSEKSIFKWETMGQKFTSNIREYIPNNYLAWESLKNNIQGYHVWLIIPTEKGCRLITDESQNGSLVFWEKLFQPKKLKRLHDDWLRGIKVKAESSDVSNSP